MFIKDSENTFNYEWRITVKTELNKLFKKASAVILCLQLSLCSAFFMPNLVYAEADYQAQMEERKSLPIQSNELKNWPEGPAIGAKAAIVMEMNTHTILYSKNIHEELYPASTTKILTCLLAAQNCSLNDIVTFSEAAVHGVPSDGSNMGMDTNESITLEQAMYGVLVGSANEAAAAVGEHVATSLGYSADYFPTLMNEYAKSLGCENTHFTNANGLFNENHYTSVYDLALIGCEFFNNEILCKMSSTPSYHIAPTSTQPDDIWIGTKNQLYKGKPYEYEYLLGSKTGYVSQSRQTLVSAAEKDGMKLVCVVFMEESPYQYTDTISLFNYGFENFQKLSIEENESRYVVSNNDLFDTTNDLFGDSSPLLSLEQNTYIILPKSAIFDDAVSTISYHDDSDSQVVATIDYTFSDVNVGSCDIVFSKSEVPSFSFSEGISSGINNINHSSSDQQNVIFINVRKLIFIILAIALGVILIQYLISLFKSYNFSPKGQSMKRKFQRGKEQRLERKMAKQKRKKLKKLQKQRRKAYKKRNK